MNYYIGRLAVFNGGYESHSDTCIVAADEVKARQLLSTRAQRFVDAPAELEPDGCYRFKGHDVLAVRPQGLTEVSAVTFQEMAALLPVLGASAVGSLAQEPDDERVKTLARRLGDQLAKQAVKVPHSKLLHAVSASLGETDWHVLLNRAQSMADAKSLGAEASAAQEAQGAEESFAGYDNLYGQIPGSGFLYRVPVSVDTSMTALVLARGATKDEAVENARRFASEGNARFEVDDGNYRGYSDHYVSDDSDEGVYRVLEPVNAKPSVLENGGAALGAYVVELFDLGEADDELLWADLAVFSPDQDEPDTESAMSACPRSASREARDAFCVRIVQMLHRGAPDVSKVNFGMLRHVFIQAAQGEQSDEAYAALEAKLRDATQR